MRVILSGAKDLALEALVTQISLSDPAPFAGSLTSFGMTALSNIVLNRLRSRFVLHRRFGPLVCRSFRAPDLQ